MITLQQILELVGALVTLMLSRIGRSYEKSEAEGVGARSRCAHPTPPSFNWNVRLLNCLRKPTISPPSYF
jgi:hypothetical protein